MKKALIIGGAGFVGHYLADHLYRQYGWSVCCTKLALEQMQMNHGQIVNLDILDRAATERLIAGFCPDYIFHLAAQSSVALSWKRPDLTVDVNIKGAVYVLEAVRRVAERTGHKPRVLLVGSGEEYGYIEETELPIREENPIRPGNIYAATKACQNLLGQIYARAYGLDVMMIRAFNIIGPGQTTQFVVSDFCKQAADIEAGKQPPVLSVGNLSARRDFTDVRDVVRAYGMLAQTGKSGVTYNVGSGRDIAISLVLAEILRQAKCEIRVETDPDRMRPSDVPVIAADISRLLEATDWKPEIPLEQTIGDVLDYWRNQNQENAE